MGVGGEAEIKQESAMPKLASCAQERSAKKEGSKGNLCLVEVLRFKHLVNVHCLEEYQIHLLHSHKSIVVS